MLIASRHSEDQIRLLGKVLRLVPATHNSSLWPRPARGAGTLIPSAQRLVWAAKQLLGQQLYHTMLLWQVCRAYNKQRRLLSHHLRHKLYPVIITLDNQNLIKVILLCAKNP